MISQLDRRIWRQDFLGVNSRPDQKIMAPMKILAKSRISYTDTFVDEREIAAFQCTQLSKLIKQ